jgi:3'(2'), 5'-bisphosphate nucleotidase
MASVQDHQLAAQLAADAGTLLTSVRREAEAAGTEPKELGQRGDRASNQLILDTLSAQRPDDAVLSEEAVDDPRRLDTSRVWIVDPLDGTREFTMPGRTDWAVHIALWEAGVGITSAAVALPAIPEVWSTARPLGVGAVPADERPMRVLVSDTRPPSWLPQLTEVLDIDVIPMGSAGAKTAAVLRGDADAYVHDGGQYEWDSAAPVGVAVAAGLHASRLDGTTIQYNQAYPYLPDLVICRPSLAGELLGALGRLVHP